MLWPAPDHTLIKKPPEGGFWGLAKSQSIESTYWHVLTVVPVQFLPEIQMVNVETVTPDKLVESIEAPDKLVPEKFALVKLFPNKLAPTKPVTFINVDPVKFTRLYAVEEKLAPLKLTPVKLAPVRSARVRLDPLISALLMFTLARFHAVQFAFGAGALQDAEPTRPANVPAGQVVQALAPILE